MNGMRDKTVLITGGGAGLGRALVRRFSEEGAHIGVLERSQQKADELKEELTDVEVVTGDVRSIDDNLAAVRATVARFGKLDVFIGNAGILDNLGSLLDVPANLVSDAFDEVMGVNVKGYILGARAAIPELLKTEGSIVFTASSASYIPGGGNIFYTASKHAVVGVVRELAYQLAPKIRVNAVAPGPMRTQMRGSEVLGEHERQEPDDAAWEQIKELFPLSRIDPYDYTGMYVALASQQISPTTTGIVVDAADGIGARGHFAISAEKAKSAK